MNTMMAETEMTEGMSLREKATIRNGLNALAQVAARNAMAKGFRDPITTDLEQRLVRAERIALMHSELSEALEELRAGNDPATVYYNPDAGAGLGKPEGYGIELADAVIRIADACGVDGLNLGDLVAQKLAYNAGRPVKHGKAF